MHDHTHQLRHEQQRPQRTRWRHSTLGAKYATAELHSWVSMERIKTLANEGRVAGGRSQYAAVTAAAC